MVIKEFFDVVVLGTSISPLVAGALLCRRGLRVLVVGNGEIHDENPSYLFSALTSPLVMRIFEELGASHQIRRMVRRGDPCFQVILPTARIDVSPEKEIFEREIAREFPDIAEEIRSAELFEPRLHKELANIVDGEHLLPPDGFFQRKKIEMALSRSPLLGGGMMHEYGSRVLHHPTFGPYMRGVVAAGSQLAPKSLGPAGLFFIHDRKMGHCALFEGGPRALKRILLDRIDSYGGEARPSDVVEEVILRGKRVAAVRLAGRESLIGCDFLLSGIESGCFDAMLVREGRPLRTEILGGPVLRPTGLLVTTDLQLRREVIPEPMARNVIVIFDPRAPLRESNFLWADLAEEGEGGGANRGKMTLHYILDREKLGSSPSYSTDILHSILEKLNAVIPFLRDNVLECRDPVESILKSHFTEDPLRHMSRLMPSVYEYTKPPMGPFLGLGHRTPLKNVFRVGAEVCPSLGEDGLWLSSLGAARIITSLRKSKTKLRRRIMFT